MVMSNQPQEVVQDLQQGPHVPVLCGLKGYRSENCTTSIIMPKNFNGDVKLAPRSCSGQPTGTPCPSSLGSEGLSVWELHHKYNFVQGFWCCCQISSKNFYITIKILWQNYTCGMIFRTVSLQTTENWDMGSLLEVPNNFLGLISHHH